MVEAVEKAAGYLKPGCIFTPTGGSLLFFRGCFPGGLHLSQEEELIMLLIGLTGKAFAGKDLVAMHLLRQHGFSRWPLPTRCGRASKRC